MTKFHQTHAAALRLICWTALAALSIPGAAEDNPAITPNAIIRQLEAMQAAWPQPGVTMQGTVKFVVGNDIWQPRQQFKAGPDWLALACDGKGCVLAPAALSVKQELRQGHYDDSPTYGQKLSFTRPGQSSGQVVAWFHRPGAPTWLSPGSVASYFAPPRELKPPPHGRGTMEAQFNLPDGQEMRLVPAMLTREVLNKSGADEDRYSPSILLQVRVGGHRQVLLGTLGRCGSLPDPRRYLLWAGDLDRDTKPDFLLSFVDADGPVHLYLSSAATSGQLVGLAGIYLSPPFGGECDGSEW